MVSKSRKTGDLGESIACRFLINKGFSIVERNYLKKWGEIDIIAKKDGKAHFIEVKSVSCPPARNARAGRAVPGAGRYTAFFR